MPANKFTTKQKLKYVQYHLKTGSYKAMEGVKYTTACSQTRQWTKMYNLYGIEGLKPKDKRRVYTCKERCEAVKRVLKGYSYTEVANDMGMTSGNRVGAWYQVYLKKGFSGLKYNKRYSNNGLDIRITETTIKKYLHNKNKIIGLLEDYRQCKAENIYLKKVFALIPKK